jgi:hypothetical protein
VRTPDRYIAAIVGGRSPEAAGEVLDDDARTLERLQLALRTGAGVEDEALPNAPELQRLVWRDHGRAGLTAEGRLLANEVAARLVVPAD